MKYHELDTSAKKSRKRVGRGISAGGGKTAGRGTKGQGARTGKKLNPIVSFQGGSASIVRTQPKLRGFTNLRKPAQVVYADKLNSIKDSRIDNFTLFENGLIANPYHAVKIIAGREKDAEFTNKAEVQVAGMSKSVQEMLARNGGRFAKTAVPIKKSKKIKEEKPEKE